ncbi:MAG: hypothetical protein IJK31_08605 [Ruminococcus sp.]|nr:hypothetical protein [Ruminococcus sp.]
MNISIDSAATFYPESLISADELAKMAGISTEEVLKKGVNSIHAAEKGTLTTDMAVKAVNEAIGDIDPKSIDQLAFISEGVSDYLYMDPSKNILKKIGGRIEDLIYSSDYFRGNNGTVGIIRTVGNQLRGNPQISRSVIATSLIWSYHSDNRRLGDAFLGDGAGALMLTEGGERNKILSIALKSLSEYNMISGFRYGGTLNEIDQEIARTHKFIYEILDKEHYNGMIEHISEAGKETANNALKKAGLTSSDISYIGICGFNKKINDEIVSDFGCSNVIDPLSDRGYLGSLGVIDVISSFVNDNTVRSGDKILIIAVGIDANVEAMVIEK